jgi:PAP2 superfamily protein
MTTAIGLVQSVCALRVVTPRSLPAQDTTATERASSASAVRGQLVRRDSASAYRYTRPRPFHAIIAVPGTLGASAREAVRARYLPMWLAVAASTSALIAADEPVLDETRRLARRVGLPPNHPSADLRLGPFKQPLPTTLGSGLYFLGDGMMSVFLATGFAVRGSLADDMRARRTASEIIEGLLAAGTVTQVLKHATGRQTPSEATVPRGRWRPFARLSDYNANVPAYDAFPSGHLASTMATVTVMAMNYPEHKFIWPVGSVAMGVLTFAMVNNGVHWASDYPLALAIGGVVGKVVVSRGRTVVRDSTAPPHPVEERPRFEIAPVLAPGRVGVSVTW